MVHQYKLVYFNIRGRAEPARLIFAYAGVNYEDQRLEYRNIGEFGDDFKALKPNTPFGQVPILDIDNGKVILGQSKAIARYLGKEFNLVPKDHIQAAKADMYVDGTDDLYKHYHPWFMEKDPAKKKEIWQKLEVEHIAPFLKRYENFLTESGGSYFLGNEITWADLYLVEVIASQLRVSSHLADGLPKLKEFVEKILKEPKIHAWLEKRPKTDIDL